MSTQSTGFSKYERDGARQKPVAVEPMAVPSRVAAQMLGIGKTRLFCLIREGEIQSYFEGSDRRILTSSIRDYVARKLEATRNTA
jgi:excisionase family DNA binding protein